MCLPLLHMTCKPLKLSFWSHPTLHYIVDNNTKLDGLEQDVLSRVSVGQNLSVRPQSRCRMKLQLKAQLGKNQLSRSFTSLLTGFLLPWLLTGSYPQFFAQRLLYQADQNVAAGFLRARSKKNQRETASKREVGLLSPHHITFPALYSREVRPAHTLGKGISQGHGYQNVGTWGHVRSCQMHSNMYPVLSSHKTTNTP